MPESNLYIFTKVWSFYPTNKDFNYFDVLNRMILARIISKYLKKISYKCQIRIEN